MRRTGANMQARVGSSRAEPTDECGSMTRSLRAVFRCDASTALGGDHVARCLVLARALQDQGWSCLFAVSRDTLATVPRLCRVADTVLTLDGSVEGEPASICEWLGCRADLLVVDHHRHDIMFESASRQWTRRILVIDDLADRAHDADLLLSPTFGRGAADYAGLVPRHCRVLTGSGYALLHPAFAAARTSLWPERQTSRALRRILVAFGATDPWNATCFALRAIAASGLDVEVDIVLGGAAPELQAVRAQAAALTQPTRLFVDAGPKKIAALMLGADLSIGAGGGMTWERCCLGLPTVMLATAPHQHIVCRQTQTAGAALFAGSLATADLQAIGRLLRDIDDDAALRQRMARAGAPLCDGRGARRALAAIVSFHARRRQTVTHRPATMDDAERMFVWHTEPPARPCSRNAELPLAWDMPEPAEPLSVGAAARNPT